MVYTHYYPYRFGDDWGMVYDCFNHMEMLQIEIYLEGISLSLSLSPYKYISEGHHRKPDMWRLEPWKQGLLVSHISGPCIYGFKRPVKQTGQVGSSKK